MTEQRPPLPPFTRDSAIQKVRAAEDGWNSRDPAKVALAYTLSGATTAATGFARMAMRTGSLISTD